MPIIEIPQMYGFVCDVCGMQHLQESDENLPKGWCRVILDMKDVVHDGDGYTGTEIHFLCSEHAAKVVDVIYAVEKEEMGDPCAWRCKDYADGWIIYQDKENAVDYQEKTGCLMQALYSSS